MIGLLLAFLATGAALQAGADKPRAPQRDACALLEAGEIRAVQHVAVEEQKASQQDVRGLTFAQCVFATTDFARSVSLTLVTANGDGSGAAARSYWTDVFYPRPKAVAGTTARPPKKKNPPRPIPGIGDEAFWTGDEHAGALYVLGADTVLRISVGGVSNEEERIGRSKVLAGAALDRLQPGPRLRAGPY
jgi:hypothetical protein